jgi:hypothetical protein
MNRAIVLTLLSGTAMLAPLGAQMTEQRRATMRGNGDGDGGKCTIEVRVDGSAEVEIRGDRGILRTTAGQPARWVRFECDGVPPTNPVDFKFKGVDGRGRQTLLADPRNSRGAAVIGLSDPDGGSEGYTFDIEWKGGTNYGNAGVPGRGGRYNDRNNNAGDWGNSVNACESAVRDRAYQQYGTRDIQIRTTDADNRAGRRDSVEGFVELRRNNRRESYQYSCVVNSNNGNVRSVDLRPAGSSGSYFPGSANRDNNSDDSCQRAVAERLQRDGYSNIRVDSMSGRNRNDRVTGRATAQRGRSSYDFDVACSVGNGGVREVDVIRR